MASVPAWNDTDLVCGDPRADDCDGDAVLGEEAWEVAFVGSRMGKFSESPLVCLAFLRGLAVLTGLLVGGNAGDVCWVSRSAVDMLRL